MFQNWKKKKIQKCFSNKETILETHFHVLADLKAANLFDRLTSSSFSISFQYAQQHPSD